ncbi:MAG: TetR/AcrR family transcriptional regulator [Henriciella sp.]|nr:TetR/AcrR family transcriptional regulator [Henriciella sp.]
MNQGAGKGANVSGLPVSRRLQQKEAKRAALVDAALKVFSRVGFAAAKMDDVAEEAGVSKGTVYLYFDSKERLFEAMVRDKMAPALDEAVESFTVSDSSATERLRQHLRSLYARMLDGDRRQIMRLIMAEGPNFPHLAAFYHQRILSHGQGLIRSIISQGVASGEFRKMEGHGLARNIAAGAIVAAIWKLVFDHLQPIELDSYLETHVDLVLNGLRA